MANNVSFRLFSLGYDGSDQGTAVMPDGTMVFQALGFPRDVDNHTCIPARGVGYWGRTNVTELDRQWYKPLEPVQTEKLAGIAAGTHRIGPYLCHPRRPDPSAYLISSLAVEDQVIHSIQFQADHIVFCRLGHEVSLDLSSVHIDTRFTLAAEWSPSHLELRVTWTEGDGLEKFYSGEGVKYDEFPTYVPPDEGQVHELRQRTEFSLAIVPSNLLRRFWSHFSDLAEQNDRDQTAKLRPESLRKTYTDASDFEKTFGLILTEVQTILNRIRPTAFWDGKYPKSEPDAGGALRGLFEAICPLKNIKVFQEDPSRSGRVDLIFSAISKAHTHLELVMELKHAHSPKLEAGLSTQLPHYVLERGSDIAVYGVFWYKGMHFDKPQTISLDNLLANLVEHRPGSVNSICAFDVSYKTPASKLKPNVA